MSMFKNGDEFEIKAALHYQDHPIASYAGNYIYLNSGTRTVVDVSIEEVNNTSHKLGASILGLMVSSIN